MAPTTCTKALALIATAFISGGVASAADTQDPFVGTWLLNPAKSTCDPPPAPKSHTFRIAKVKGRQAARTGRCDAQSGRNNVDIRTEVSEG